MTKLKNQTNFTAIMRRVIVTDMDTYGIIGKGYWFKGTTGNVITELFDLKGEPLPESIYRLAFTDEPERLVVFSSLVQ